MGYIFFFPYLRWVVSWVNMEDRGDWLIIMAYL